MFLVFCFVLFCFNSPCRNAFEFGFTTHMTRTQMETCGAKTETYHNKKTNSNEMTWKWKLVVAQLVYTKLKNHRIPTKSSIHSLLLIRLNLRETNIFFVLVWIKDKKHHDRYVNYHKKFTIVEIFHAVVTNEEKNEMKSFSILYTGLSIEKSIRNFLYFW